jgi:hypothetical protein
MEKYDLKGEDVARMLGVTTRRVYGWLSVGQTTPIPTTKLQLLELLLGFQETRPARRPAISFSVKMKRPEGAKKERRGGKAK